MVRQVFVLERVTYTDDNGNTRTQIRNQLAFGSHPDLPDDDGEVTSAVADTRQKIRVVVDELLQGNYLEEIACADGTWSTVPVGANPDDIARCAGPDLSQCTGDHAVCIGDGGPVGILDENEDGAADDSRLLDGVMTLTCDGVEMPIDRQLSFYQPAGNQQIPAGAGINGLGPALVMQPTQGLRTGASCGITFAETVVDKDGNQVCAPEGGDIAQPCTPGDTSIIQFNVEPLRVTGTDPPDEAQNVALTLSGSEDAQILVQFNARLDPDSVAGVISLADDNGEVGGLPDPMVSADDPTVAIQIVPGGYDELTEYTVTVNSGDNGIADQFGGTMPQDHTFSFTTREATAMPDAAVEPDAGDGDAGQDDAGADAGADAMTDA